MGKNKVEMTTRTPELDRLTADQPRLNLTPKVRNLKEIFLELHILSNRNKLLISNSTDENVTSNIHFHKKIIF